MNRRSMGGPLESSRDATGEAGEGVPPEDFKETLARWATGVCVVAVRDERAEVYATTVGSFASVSAEPPLVMFSLGTGAQVLPFLEEGTPFVVNVLSSDQQRLATDFADPFPVGPSPFEEGEAPAITGAHATMGCRVHRIVPAESSRIVIGLVESTSTDPARAPLLYYMRGYRRLADEG